MVGTNRLWRALILTLTVVLTTATGMSGVGAASPADAQSSPLDLDTTVEKYNERRGEVPSIVNETISDEQVVIEVDEADGDTEKYYIKLNEDGRITDHGDSEFSDGPTIRLETDEETLNDIQQADDQKVTAIQALDDDDIEAEGLNMVTKMKVNFAESVLAAKNFT